MTKLISEVVETMANGAVADRVECPVCRHAKHPQKWVCNACFVDGGFALLEAVQEAVRLAAGKVSEKIPTPRPIRVRNDAEHEKCWQTALAAVRSAFPAGKFITPAFFSTNPAKFNGSIIGETMMKAACAHVQKERAQKALAREMEERAKADSAKTLQRMARFTASPEMKAAARRRKNSSAVPAMA